MPMSAARATKTISQHRALDSRLSTPECPLVSPSQTGIWTDHNSRPGRRLGAGGTEPRGARAPIGCESTRPRQHLAATAAPGVIPGARDRDRAHTCRKRPVAWRDHCTVRRRASSVRVVRHHAGAQARAAAGPWLDSDALRSVVVCCLEHGRARWSPVWGFSARVARRDIPGPDDVHVGMCITTCSRCGPATLGLRPQGLRRDDTDAGQSGTRTADAP